MPISIAIEGFSEMTDQQKTREIHLTQADLDAMPEPELKLLLGKAVKIKGTAVVRRADGSIKYDDGVPRDAQNPTEPNAGSD